MKTKEKTDQNKVIFKISGREVKMKNNNGYLYNLYSDNDSWDNLGEIEVIGLDMHTKPQTDTAKNNEGFNIDLQESNSCY